MFEGLRDWWNETMGGIEYRTTHNPHFDEAREHLKKAREHWQKFKEI
jgi:hypothetical protein